jgi:hypothetical protein
MDLVVVFRTCGLGGTTVFVTVGAVSMLGFLVLRVVDADRFGGQWYGRLFCHCKRTMRCDISCGLQRDSRKVDLSISVLLILL